MPWRPPCKNSFPDASLQAEAMAFFRIEQEDAKFVLNDKEEHPLHDGDAIVIPVGTYHNVVNTSKRAMLKLNTIYSPLKHPGRDSKTVNKTKAETEAAEVVEHP
jgi:mannose-6-phosphate isomerase-like protein (cupin superfamily)